MSKTLSDIAQELKISSKKVQLIYAFNGMGKTRLSRAFKELIAPKSENSDAENLPRHKILYYNAFTEDLFYWDNDLSEDKQPKLKIQPNSFTHWILKEQGQEQNIVSYFQHCTNTRLTPDFNKDYSEVTFSYQRGDDENSENIKISKGEESCFIWSIFYALIKQVIAELNIAEAENRSTNEFDHLEYIFIDDPVSSLDENHLIELAVNTAELIKSSESKAVNFIITTHNPLFYNVLYNELDLKKNKNSSYLLKKYENGEFELVSKKGDSNKSFSYHLFLKQTLEQAIQQKDIQKYHFTLLRNLYEKTASFLGYNKWSELLPDDKRLYLSRIMNFTSHSTLSNEAIAEPTPQEKEMISFLLNHLVDNYSFYKQESKQ